MRAAPALARGRASTADRDEDLARTRALPIDPAYLREIVEQLAALGSSPLGFRVGGTREDRQAAELAERELHEIGLADVAIEDVRVDGWSFESASVVAGEHEFEAVSWGGMPPTPPQGITGRFVYAGTAERRRLDRLDVAGAIVLVDWRGAASPSETGLELGLRGAAGLIVNCPTGGRFFQSDRALGSFGAAWHDQAPTMVLIRKEDARALRAAAPAQVRITLRAEILPDVPGCNAVGYLPGETPGAPVVVGAHHDGWFRGAFDNATGVAATLAIARAFAASGWRPRHPICFASRTSEEYAVTGTEWSGLEGAWQQVAVTHPTWGSDVPFHLCVEASGHPDLRLLVHAPVELARWARAACRAGEREGWVTRGWRVSPPALGTEQWPFLVAGVPSVTVYTWDKPFPRTDYHTPYDTPEIVDYDYLAGLTRLYAFMLLTVDRDPGRILDHRARARQLEQLAAEVGEAGQGLRDAAKRHGAVRGRKAFTRIGRDLHAVKAKGGIGYPHEQAAADAENLQAAIEALRADDTALAVRKLSAVGDNALARSLSEEAMDVHAARRRTPPAGSWGLRSHLTSSPILWRELASLRGEPGARAAGPWIERSLQRHLTRSRAEVTRRLAGMTRSLS